MRIDLLSPQSFVGGQPHDQFAWLRAHDPVHWHPEPDGPGFWAVTRFADVLAVDRDHAAFSSEPTIMIRDPGPGEAGAMGPYKMMLMMDPPEHTAFRRLVRAEFTEAAAERWRARMADLARQIVDRVAGRGECDFVAEVAGEMPSYVIAELLGLPLEDGRGLYALTEAIHTAPEAQAPGAGARAVAEMFGYGMRLLEAKRRAPGEDLASKLIAAEVGGRRLADPEFLLFFLLLVDAGGDTTRNLLAGGLLALMDHPEALAWLAADLPARLPAAREELLRWTSPVVHMRRTARRDVEIAGRPVRAGEKVVMYFGAANRDPAAIERPDVLDLARAPNEHLAFGAGAHVCLGKHLARLEIDAMLAEVLGRLRDFDLPEPPEWLASNFISGPRRMPLRYRAR